ncbi:hypothetical protein SDC9_211983 [bioreactor metagenome]|uniref:Uncharacterized protein n=1 Tax=bioreactor metagenome TaxID=1076179 RepID=A0A645JLQ8_9ZZZZ
MKEKENENKTAPEVPVQEQSNGKFVPEDSDKGICNDLAGCLKI